MALDLSRIRAVCFDIDGTLSDTDDVWTEALSRALFTFNPRETKRGGADLARRLVMAAETPANTVLALLDKLGLDSAAAAISNNLHRLTSRRRGHHFHLVPGVMPMLQVVAARYPITIVSARGENSSLAFLDQFGIRKLFKCVATALTTEFTKPYPDPLFWSAAKLSVLPSQLLMVGDTTADIRAGKAAGAQTVGVLCGFGEEAELVRAGADIILPSTADLAAALELA